MFASLQSSRTWNTRFAGKEALASPKGNGYLCGNLLMQPVVAHRVAWALYYGEWPQVGPHFGIDHINGNKTDNRIKNLRDVSGSVNSRNRRKNCTNSSGRCGVGWVKHSNKWRAYIKTHGRMKHLGMFDDKSEAIAAREAVEKGLGFTERHGV